MSSRFGQLIRLYKYARPYWKLIILVLLLSAMYAATRALPIRLTREFIDNGIIPALNIGSSDDKPAVNYGLDFFKESDETHSSAVGASASMKKIRVSANYGKQADSVKTGFFSTPFRTVVTITILVGILGIAAFVSMFFKEILRRYIGFRILVSIRQHLGEYLLSMSMGFFSTRRIGELMSRLTNDISYTNNALDFIFGDILQQPLIMASALFMAFSECWQLGIIVFCIMPVLIYPIGRLGRKITKTSLKTLEKLADVTEEMQQMFTGIRIVKAFSLEEKKAGDFYAANMQFLRKMMRVVRTKALSRSSIEVMYIWGSGVLMLVGWYLVINNMWGLTLGRLMAFVAAMALAYKPAKTLVRAFNTVHESLAGCERVFHILDIKPDIEDATDAVEMDKIRQSITYKDVWFAYDSEPVLKDINIEIRKGEVVAIVGHSGSGKSTLCDLLLRFYDPTEGSISLDKTDIRKIKRSSLLSHIAVVTQDPFLFNTSIKENIKYGKQDASDDDIFVAARAANIHDFITSLDQGYDTIVGERGVMLSGGEKQRITIARAIIKDAPVLILDEATSSLDSESEQAVQAALNNLMIGRTTFVIAHRLSTIQHADKIVVLENGRIVQVGSHSELLSKGGMYKRLYNMQFVEN